MLMLHNMPRGKSGRVVVEMDPSLKGDLYDALEKDGLTLKDWVLSQAERYLSERDQLRLFEEPSVEYKTKAKREKEKKK